MRISNKATAPSDWLSRFTALCADGDGDGIAALFQPDGFWRDYLPFGWTLQTVEGTDAIREFAGRTTAMCGFRDAAFEGETEDEGFIRFKTDVGNGRGYIRLKNGLCHTLFTQLDDLSHAAEDRAQPDNSEPFVLIIGGGQGGLALGAQLADTGVPYLIVEKESRVGDQWRSRYKSLVLHDPVWYDHMPFIPFPNDWPVFTPKDMLGDWLEAYAKRQSLNIWTNTEFTGARFDENRRCWDVTVRNADKDVTLTPSHLVVALGISGFPNLPVFEGQETFLGDQHHSSSFAGGEGMAGKNVIVIGSNNSAHDIAADLAANGANPVMVQRSSTLVVRQGDYCEKILGALYSQEAVDKGITTDKADILTASSPIRLLEQQHRLIWNDIRKNRKAYYQRLIDAGFNLDFAEDGTGLGMKYRRTASGYYIDVGAAEIVVDGRIGVRSGATVDRVTESGVLLSTGEVLPADMIIYATGFGNMTDWVSALISPEVSKTVGPCWGYGSGTKGDPGPWLGELRNMWMPTAQEGLWFMGGNLAQARYYSRLLGLQLCARYLRIKSVQVDPVGMVG